MEREGTPPKVATASRHIPSAFASASPRGRFFFGRLCRSVLAVLLAATMLPLLPASQVIEEAEALEGTTDYSKIFEGVNVFGKPVMFVGEETARLASTLQSSHYEAYEELPMGVVSLGAFVSSRPVSLNNSWEVEFDVTVPTVPYLAEGYGMVGVDVIFGLQQSRDLRNTTASAWCLNGHRDYGMALQSSIFTC